MTHTQNANRQIEIEFLNNVVDFRNIAKTAKLSRNSLSIIIKIIKTMKKILFDTSSGYGPFLVRVALGSVLFAHGAQKLLGWFGGFGFEGSMNYFTEQRGLPWFIGFLVILIEFFGALAVIVGAATRLWSLGILGVMSAVIITTFNDHFFMNWFGTQKEEGYEFFLLAIGMSASLVISGAGSLSVDRVITKKDSGRSSGSNASYPLAA
jgi:putative oxidoreductase